MKKQFFYRLKLDGKLGLSKRVRDDFFFLERKGKRFRLSLQAIFAFIIKRQLHSFINKIMFYAGFYRQTIF
jgi:hypothetical protein